MAILTKEQILAAPDLKRETVAVPEWGGEVILREMNGAQRDEYLGILRKAQEAGGASRSWQTAMVAFCLVDEGGTPLFTQDELANKSGRIIQVLYEKALALNAVGDGAVEQAVGNSEAAPSGDSVSA